MYNPEGWSGGESVLQAGQHIGQVYRSDAHLADSVGRYIADGLAQGEAIIVIATAANWAALVAHLARDGAIDLADAVVSGQLRVIDADVALAALMTKGMPDEGRTQERVGGIVDRARRHCAKLRIYSDLAGQLWQRGCAEAAMRLEQISSELAVRLGFTQLCGCRADENRANAYNAALDFICHAHPRLTYGDARSNPDAEGGTSTPGAA